MHGEGGRYRFGRIKRLNGQKKRKGKKIALVSRQRNLRGPYINIDNADWEQGRHYQVISNTAVGVGWVGGDMCVGYERIGLDYWLSTL